MGLAGTRGNDQTACLNDSPAWVNDQTACLNDSPAWVNDQTACLNDQPARANDPTTCLNLLLLRAAPGDGEPRKQGDF
jgi:hypothetical protein